MDTKEKIIIQRLYKIACNQQKILEKLARAQDPNVEYLKRAAETAAMNSGLNGTSFFVTRQNSSPITTPGGSPAQTVVGYTVTVSGASKDNTLRQKFMDTLRTQIKHKNQNNQN